MSDTAGRPSDEPLVRLDGVKKYFDEGRGLLGPLSVSLQGGRPSISWERRPVRAVDGVSLDIFEGEVLGLVGESGCGKSTLAKTIVRLLDPSDGSIVFDGTDITDLSGKQLRERRRDIQMVFQDPQSSLDPRMKIGEIVAEPMRVNGMYDAETRRQRVEDLLERVGLDAAQYNRYPHEFSGGQRQRVNLARALSVDPKFVVCDEPVSGLDVSVQAKVLSIMEELQADLGLTYLFISHDLSVIRYISDRVAVMYLGRIVELGETSSVFDDPAHPYTKSLIESVPIPEPTANRGRRTLRGEVPDPAAQPDGCHFHPRCPEFIPPEDIELPEEAWRETLAFVRAVERRELVAAEAESELQARFDGGLPPGAVGDTLTDAAAAVAAGEWRRATERLRREFIEPSVCTQRYDVYEVPDETGTRRVACHRHEEADLGESP